MGDMEDQEKEDSAVSHTIMVATLVYVKCARSDSYRRLRVTLSYRNVF